jgi:centromeric protein E
LISYLLETKDHVFSETTPTSTIYTTVAKNLIESAMDGMNATIFAYGQTSSGKTHTMMGNPQQPGIIPLGISEIFDLIQKVESTT